jgi:hypothetical protein
MNPEESIIPAVVPSSALTEELAIRRERPWGPDFGGHRGRSRKAAKVCGERLPTVGPGVDSIQ